MGELNAKDEKLIRQMVRSLKDKVNRKNGVKIKFMCIKMKAAGYEVTQVKLRQVIHVIRVRGLVKCLIHGPEGYYISVSMRDGQRMTGDMRNRIRLLTAEEKALTEQFNEYYSPQMFH